MTMQYNRVKGPNTLAEFLLEGLSEETLLRIYREKREVMFTNDDMTDNPIVLLRSHVSNLFYTAGYNLISNMRVDGHITEQLEEHIIDQ